MPTPFKKNEELGESGLRNLHRCSVKLSMVALDFFC